MFTFESLEDRVWVLHNQLWHFEGFLFAIQKLVGSKQPSAIRVSQASFWVRAMDLLLDCLTDDVVKMVAWKIGTLECYDSPTINNYGDFVRFKVAIDISKPLMKGIMFISMDRKL